MAPVGWLSKDVATVAVPVVTLLFGVLVGWLAQRSAFCSIGGFRDFFMWKHTRLLFGYIALIIGALTGYLVFWLISPSAFEHFFWVLTSGLTPVPGAPAGLSAAAYILLAIIGGTAIGIIGVLLGGCPLRQVVMTSEGNLKALIFVVGMGIGAVVYTMWIAGLAVSLLKGFGLA